MKSARTIIRWLALLIGVAVGLLLLNGAIFRVWMATGPPNENPAGWIFGAWSYAALSAAAVTAGIGLFLLLRLPRRTPRAIVCLALSAALSAIPWLREFIATDICLDSGGRWSTQELRCIR